MSNDLFPGVSADLDGPYNSASAITPSDSNQLATVTKALWIGGAGNLTVQLKADSAAVTFSNVPAATLLKIRAIQVMATGTTATGLVGFNQ